MIDKNSPIPVYYQLKNDLIKKIASGVWKAGECIASERELCEIYEVSRMTIRQAIGELVQEGILVRKKGKGTFVCEQKVNQKDMMSFTEIIKQSGRKLKTNVVYFEIIDTPDDMQDIFVLDKLYKITRQRIVDGECIALETVYIPEKMCAGLKEVLKEEDSLYRVFREEYNHKIEKAIQTIEPITLNKESSKLLNRDINSLALKFDRKVYTKDQSILEYTISIFTSDKHQYQIMMTE